VFGRAGGATMKSEQVTGNEGLPHYQQSCPPCRTDPPGGPTMTDAIALRPRAAG
jgi:hypothetical protein